MKYFALLLMNLLMPIMALAQSGLVAALYHGDNFKIYYSNEAFKKAMSDAEPGDIITLSPGTFLSPNINKAVTIRGAGIGAVDSINTNNTLPTILQDPSAIHLDVPSDASSGGYSLNIEGVIFDGPIYADNLSDAIFSKSRFYSINQMSDSSIYNVSFIQCVFETNINNTDFSIHNSVCLDGVSASMVSNSIIICQSNLSSKATFNNCIFIATKGGSMYGNAFNCIWFGSNPSHPFGQGVNLNPERQNKIVPDDVEIFVPGTFYQLNENGKKYLGNDGTEVGIYGSRLPFSTVTSYPQIKKFSVSPESTEEGTLQIEFEVQ